MGQPNEPGVDASRQLPMDSLDRSLVEALQEDARIPFSTLGTRLGVTGMTVANRLQRLRSHGYLQLRVVPDLDSCNLRTQILGLVQAEINSLAACGTLLRESPNVLRAHRVTGEYDLAFFAAFANEAAMGALVRDLQSIPGVRRLVVHHRLETLKDDGGWSATWSEHEEPADETYELAPSVHVSRRMRPFVAAAAGWLQAFIQGKIEPLRELSDPDIVFTIMPPYREAGTFDGFDEVTAESKRAAQVYRHLWHRIVAVSESDDPQRIVIDAFNTAERHEGQIRSSFARMAFFFNGSRVCRVVSMGQMDLPDVEEQLGLRESTASPV